MIEISFNEKYTIAEKCVFNFLNSLESEDLPIENYLSEEEYKKKIRKGIKIMSILLFIKIIIIYIIILNLIPR